MAYDPQSVALYYSYLFAARVDVYSAWTEHGWRPVRQPLTPAVVLDGLSRKGPSISGYMIAPGSTTHLFAIDFDTEDGLAQAVAVGLLLDADGLPSYIETSRRGAHLWCVLDGVLPAVLVRSAVHGILQHAGIDDPKVEIRPGSDTIAEDGLGHALRMPTMPHPRTGRRGTLSRPDGSSLGPSLADALLAIEYAPVGKLEPWAERWRRPPVTYIPPDHHRPHDPYPEETMTASQILRDLWGVKNAAPGRSVRCPAHDDKMPSLSILRDDQRVICKAGYCELNNSDRGRGTYELRTMAPANG